MPTPAGERFVHGGRDGDRPGGVARGRPTPRIDKQRQPGDNAPMPRDVDASRDPDAGMAPDTLEETLASADPRRPIARMRRPTDIMRGSLAPSARSRSKAAIQQRAKSSAKTTPQPVRKRMIFVLLS